MRRSIAQIELPLSFTKRKMSSSSLREDEISQRIFYGGLFALPWLWMVHAMGYYSKKRNTDGLLSNNSEGANKLLLHFGKSFKVLLADTVSFLPTHVRQSSRQKWIHRWRKINLPGSRVVGIVRFWRQYSGLYGLSLFNLP